VSSACGRDHPKQLIDHLNGREDIEQEHRRKLISLDSGNQSADQIKYPARITAAQLALMRLIKSRTFAPFDHGAASLREERWTTKLPDLPYAGVSV
jgi:hypothetical protein